MGPLFSRGRQIGKNELEESATPFRNWLSSQHKPLAVSGSVKILPETPVKDKASQRPRWLVCVRCLDHSACNSAFPGSPGIFTDEFTTVEHWTRTDLFPSQLTPTAESYGFLA